MNFAQKAALIALAIALPAGAVLAASPKAGAKSPHAAMMMEQFTRMDANQDGMITQKEIHGHRKDWFNVADADKDGKLSVSELDTIMAQFRAIHLERRLAMMDTDGDGAVSGDEFARHRGRWMHHLDADGDGAIDKSEVEKGGDHHGRRHRGHKTMHGQHGQQ
jgi:hypothetical protein